MRIQKLNVYCCRLPLTPIERGGIAPYQLSYRLATHADRYFIELLTDDGHSGWGEGELTMPAEAVHAFYRDLAPVVVGMDPRQVNSVRAVFQKTTLKKYLNEQVFLAPVEMACWDLFGKSVNLPLHMLLGGRRRDRVPVAFPIGILPTEQLLAAVRRAMERGYRLFKLKGDVDFREDVKRMRAAAQAVPTAEFRIDPNQAWTIPDCVRFAEACRGMNIEYLEQPVRIQSLAEAARLRQRMSIPLALNDDCYGPWTLDAIVHHGAADVAIVDLEPLGGITGLVRAAHFAETANLALAHHSGFDYGVKTAAVAHVTATLPAFRFAPDCAYMSQDGDVIAPRLTIEGGALVVPDGPGLGVQIAREKLETYRI
jgi:L-alanine-DL-glutamate epimerase-like enolase superfamily enzyme